MSENSSKSGNELSFQEMLRMIGALVWSSTMDIKGQWNERIGSFADVMLPKNSTC